MVKTDAVAQSNKLIMLDRYDMNVTGTKNIFVSRKNYTQLFKVN